MSGKYKYDIVLKGLTGMFGVVCFGVWAVKNFKGFVTEIQDTQPDEAMGAITMAATVELPKLWAAFNEPVETPLV